MQRNHHGIALDSSDKRDKGKNNSNSAINMMNGAQKHNINMKERSSSAMALQGGTLHSNDMPNSGSINTGPGRARGSEPGFGAQSHLAHQQQIASKKAIYGIGNSKSSSGYPSQAGVNSQGMHSQSQKHYINSGMINGVKQKNQHQKYMMGQTQ